MKYSINASITPNSAAKLLISNDIDLNEIWQYDQSRVVIDTLLKIKTDEFLHIIDARDDHKLVPNEVPQFSNIETLDRVPFILYERGIQCLNYAQLGFYLKNDIKAKTEANIKFGENYGKGASLLGLTNCSAGRISCSSLSNGYCQISDPNTRIRVIVRLFFRIPIVQFILKSASTNKYNAYDSMGFLSESTKKRRSQCLKKIFASFAEIEEKTIHDRLNNIYWE